MKTLSFFLAVSALIWGGRLTWIFYADEYTQGAMLKAYWPEQVGVTILMVAATVVMGWARTREDAARNSERGKMWRKYR